MNNFITVWQLTINDPSPKGEYIWFKFWLGSYRFYPYHLVLHTIAPREVNQIWENQL